MAAKTYLPNQNQKLKILKGEDAQDAVEKYFLDHEFTLLGKDIAIAQSRHRADFVFRKNNALYLVEVKNHRWLGTGFERIISKAQYQGYLYMGLALRRKYPHSKLYFCLVAILSGGDVEVLLETLS